MPSLVIKGTLDYIEAQRKQFPFSTPITVSASGQITGKIEFKSGDGTIVPTQYNFTGFDLENNIKGLTVTTPSLSDYQSYFHSVTENPDSRGAGVLDSLMQGLSRGPVVFAMYYTEGIRGGHAVVASSLEINDANANGLIDQGEGLIYLVDPLDPSQGYAPGVGNQYNNIQGTGSFKLTRGDIWQSADGFLKLSYDQKYISNKDWDQERVISLTGGDSSNNTSSSVTGADITLAMAINTSGLAPDFDTKAGALSVTTPGLVDFSFLLKDPETKNKSLKGYAYSNESSAFDNNFLYYETSDANGTITTTNPITGQSISIKPRDDGYISTAWALAQQQSHGLGPITLDNRTSEDEATLTEFRVDISQLSTGFLAPIAKTSQGDIFTPFPQGNSDKMQHFKSTGPLSWGMEDVLGLGDRDFNDLHVIILIESIF